MINSGFLSISNYYMNTLIINSSQFFLHLKIINSGF